MPIQFEFLPVDGDAILVTTEDFVMLIDGGGGGKKSYQRLKTRLEQLNRVIDLVILTHIDQDHILGLVKLFKEIRDNTTSIKIKKIWFNSLTSRELMINVGSRTTVLGPVSKKQAEDLSLLLRSLRNNGIEHVADNICMDRFPYDKEVYLTDKLKLLLLSPTRKILDEMYLDWNSDLFAKQSGLISKKNDYSFSIKDLMSVKFENDGSIRNASSIAFILIYDNKKYLLLGDANIKIILQSLRYLYENKLIQDNIFEFIKLSHHGSAKNTDDDFLNFVYCNNFFISARKGLPSKQALSRIIKKAFVSGTKANIYINRPLTSEQLALHSEELSTCFTIEEGYCFHDTNI